MSGLERDALVVNFFGGPGVGKTTAAAMLFVELKLRSADAELYDEQARQCILTGQVSALEIQPYLFGLQLYRLRTTARHTDIVVMDSPLLLNPIYDKNQSTPLRDLVLEEFYRFRNLNVVMERPRSGVHSMAGRVHDAAESRVLDERIRRFLDDSRIPYRTMAGTREDIAHLADDVVADVEAHRVQLPLLANSGG